MTDDAIARTAAWLTDATPSNAGPAPEMWAQVEIFGHRRHYGRISEVERFGAKLLRVDVPIATEAPLLGEPGRDQRERCAMTPCLTDERRGKR